MKNIKNKKGVTQFMTMATFGLAIVGLFFVVSWLINMGSGTEKINIPYLAAVDQGQQQEVAANPVIPKQLTLTEDVTITFSSWDAYAKGTNAGSGHLILQLDGDSNLNVADDGTKEKSPGAAYKVLIGNKTTSLTANSDYYPLYKEGIIPDQGTYTISGGQFKVGNGSQATFTFYNDDSTAGSAQAISTSSKKTVKWRLVANDNICIGNPDVNGQNIMTYKYNTTAFTAIKQLDASFADQTASSTPTSLNTYAEAGFALISYTFPVVCDNQEVERKVRLESGTNEPTAGQSIKMYASDITWDYDADTLALLKGVEDEDNNDIGVTDYFLGNLSVS